MFVANNMLLLYGTFALQTNTIVEMDVFLYEKMANRFSRSTHEFYACSLWQQNSCDYRWR